MFSPGTSNRPDTGPHPAKINRSSNHSLRKRRFPHRTAAIFQNDLAKHPLPMPLEGLPCNGVGCLAGPVRHGSGP